MYDDRYGEFFVDIRCTGYNDAHEYRDRDRYLSFMIFSFSTARFIVLSVENMTPIKFVFSLKKNARKGKKKKSDR